MRIYKLFLIIIIILSPIALLNATEKQGSLKAPTTESGKAAPDNGGGLERSHPEGNNNETVEGQKEDTADQEAQEQPREDMQTQIKGPSLFGTVAQGGPVMIFILFLGVAGGTILFERLIFIVKRKIWKRETLEEHLKEISSESKANFREQLEDELRDAFQLYISRIEKGMALLNGIGNIAPIVGFLGTVVGMIEAFSAIAAATTVNAKVVAVGIKVALVTTAGGLSVAAPLLIFFHFVNHLIQNILLYGEEFISESVMELPSMLDKSRK